MCKICFPHMSCALRTTGCASRESTRNSITFPKYFHRHTSTYAGARALTTSHSSMAFAVLTLENFYQAHRRWRWIFPRRSCAARTLCDDDNWILLCVFITAVPLMGPVRNPVLEHRVAPCFPWFCSFGKRTQNSRVAGASPSTSPSGDLIRTIRGSGAHPGRGQGLGEKRPTTGQKRPDLPQGKRDLLQLKGIIIRAQIM